MSADTDMVNRVADILARYPCRADAGSELDKLRRFEIARLIVATVEHDAALSRARATVGNTHE
jgi:hypothetical protein